MRAAARKLTARKHALEVQIERLRHQGWWTRMVSRCVKGIHPPIIEGYRAALWPTKFVDVCLPFSDVTGKYDDERVEVLEPHLVVGGTCMSYPDRTEEDHHQILDRLNSHTENPGDPVKRADAAQYTKVGKLPVYAAYEGKNRVELYQHLDKSIKAFVKKTAYPAPDCLRVERTFPFGHYVLICTDEDFAPVGHNKRVLPFPEAVLPLLSAYGVNISERRSQFMPCSYLAHRDARSRVTSHQMMP